MDIVVIIVLLIASVAFIPLLRSHQQSDMVQVYHVNKLIAEYPLDKDTSFTVEGRLGPAQVEINGRRARISDSSCPNHICVHTGWIEEPYQAVICAPNQLLVGIISAEDKEKADEVER